MNEWNSAQWRERNDGVIADFRANNGATGNNPLILLTTTGRKSGQPHVTPLMFTTDGDRFVVIASKGGAPKHPAWYLNLAANPEVTIEYGPDKFSARATDAVGDEYERLFAQQAAKYPFFSDYRAKAGRHVPVVVIERLPG